MSIWLFFSLTMAFIILKMFFKYIFPHSVRDAHSHYRFNNSQTLRICSQGKKKNSTLLDKDMHNLRIEEALRDDPPRHRHWVLQEDNNNHHHHGAISNLPKCEIGDHDLDSIQTWLWRKCDGWERSVFATKSSQQSWGGSTSRGITASTENSAAARTSMNLSFSAQIFKCFNYKQWIETLQITIMMCFLNLITITIDKRRRGYRWLSINSQHTATRWKVVQRALQRIRMIPIFHLMN